MILESIEESPASRPNLKMNADKDLNFEKLMVQRQESPSNGMEVDDEEDGLPKTQEANDIIVRQKSGELDKIDAPDPISSSF